MCVHSYNGILFCAEIKIGEKDGSQTLNEYKDILCLGIRNHVVKNVRKYMRIKQSNREMMQSHVVKILVCHHHNPPSSVSLLSR